MQEQPQFENQKEEHNARDIYELLRSYTTHAVTIENGANHGLDTFAISLDGVENGRQATVYYSPRYFEEQGYDPVFAVKSTFHEAEHLNELLGFLRDKNGGVRMWQSHMVSLSNDEAYRIMDNCFDDRKMDATVEVNAPVLTGVSKRLCGEKQFPPNEKGDRSFLDLPKHLQFAYALKAEGITGERYEVSEDVRAELDRLQNFGEGEEKTDLLHAFSTPKTLMSERLFFQEQILRPILKKFKKDDDENWTPKSDGTGETEGESKEGEEKEGDENKYSNVYKKFWKQNPKPVELDPTENPELAKQIEVLGKAIEKQNEDPNRKARELRAKEEGVTLPEKESYENFLQTLTHIDAIREELKKLVQRRMIQAQAPKYPVDEGETLVDPAGAFVAVKSNERRPKVWMTDEEKPQEKSMIANFDLHIVSDTSSSMVGEKALEQRKAVVTVLEAMKELYDELESLKSEGGLAEEDELSIRTECLTFGSTVTEVKKLGETLSWKERVAMFQTLGKTPGSTKDFLAIEHILKKLDSQTEVEIKEGKRIKLVIVTTDGQSDAPEALKNKVEALRSKGAIVVGVGVTQDGKVVVENYKSQDADFGGGIVIDKAEDMSKVFAHIINHYLQKM